MASYRLLTYAAGRNDPRAGLLLDGTRVVDLVAALRAHRRATGKAPGFPGATTASVLANWSKARPVLNAIARDGVQRVRARPLSRTRLLPPLPDVRTIYCAGANYYDPRRRSRRDRRQGRGAPLLLHQGGGLHRDRARGPDPAPRLVQPR